MRRLFVFTAVTALTFGLASAGPGTAKPTADGLLTSDEIRAEFPGTRMHGVLLGGGSFSECVEPGGRSIFSYEGVVNEGHMTVGENGQVCFAYTNGTSCYRIQRSPKGYLVRSIDGSAVFHATRIERGIRSCVASELIG